MNTAARRTPTKGRRFAKVGAALSAVIALSIAPITVANASTTEPLSLGETLSVTAAAAEQSDIPTFAPADQTVVNVGAGGTYSAFGGMLIRNTGTSVISGDVGVGPSENITGLETSDIGGTIHSGDAHATAGYIGFDAAYNQVEARAVDVNLTGDLSANTLDPGTYAAADLTVDRVTLIGDASSVFIFKVDNVLTFRPGALITLQGGVKPENVIWHSKGSIFIGATTYLAGVFLADDIIDTGAGAEVYGRLFARDGDLILNSTTINSVDAPTGTTPAIEPQDPATPAVPSAPADPAVPAGGNAVDAAAAPADSAVLASTGAEVAAPGIAAGLLIAFGGLLYLLGRRYRIARAAAHRA